MKNPIETALDIALKAHAGCVDKDGHPVILHPLTVGLMGHTDEEKMGGFLHDVIEDSSITANDLLAAGIPVGVVNALTLLTHNKAEDYYEYVQRIIDSGNPIALQVKYNDLRHNFARGKNHPDLQKKHGRALEMVKAAVESCSHIELYREPKDVSTAVFAGGCYWGVQHEFEKIEGVVRTLVGYTGGTEQFPTYSQVRDCATSHVEAVVVEYDPKKVDYSELCKVFFEIHDPAQTDGVGEDVGPQYRSCIFCNGEMQHKVAHEVIAILRNKGYEVNTLVLPRGEFWIGEEYQQKYYEKTGGSPYCHFRVKKF